MYSRCHRNDMSNNFHFHLKKFNDDNSKNNHDRITPTIYVMLVYIEYLQRRQKVWEIKF